MLKLVCSAVFALALVALSLLAFSQIYDSSIAYDGPAYPKEEITQRVVATKTNTIREKKDCFEEADKVKEAAQRYRSCSDVSECQYMPYGFVSMLAVNKIHANTVGRMYKELNNYCGQRQSHDAFYSEYGIKMQCINQKCTMSDISSEEKRQELTRDSLETISED